MISGSFALSGIDLAQAAGHVRAGLERAGFTDLYLIRTGDGFRVRGVRGGHALATLASYTPLVLIGWFSRCAVDVRCLPSLREGDPRLIVKVRVRSIRELDDQEEWDMITRGPVEILGDFFQNRRIFQKTMDSLSRPTDAPPVDLDGNRRSKEERAEQIARALQRYHAGSRRRLTQVLLAIMILAAVSLLGLFLQ